MLALFVWAITGAFAEMYPRLPLTERVVMGVLSGVAFFTCLAAHELAHALVATRARWDGAQGVFATLALVNVGLALFNLVPGLPLDGGRLLRAGLWRVTGDHARSTRVAAGAGSALAGILIAAGIVVAFRREAVGLWYVMLGGFLWILARASAVTRAPAPEGALALHDEGQAPQPRS